MKGIKANYSPNGNFVLLYNSVLMILDLKSCIVLHNIIHAELIIIMVMIAFSM